MNRLLEISVRTLLIIFLILSVSFDVKAQDKEAISNLEMGYINIDNDKIFYESSGKGSVIVFIHDGLVHREIWDSQFSYFSKEYKVVRYDRRGYGNSSAGTVEYTDIEDLNSLLNHLKIDNACLIAMSSGGRLAINFTLKYPEKVTSLILVGAVVGGFSYTEHFYSRGGHLASGLSRSEIQEYYVNDDPYELYKENVYAKEKVLHLVKTNPRRGHGSRSNVPPSKPAFKRLNEIAVPSLILVGEFDIPDVHAHAGVINAGILNSKRDIINKSGHLIPIEQPELFNNKVKEFFNKLYEKK
ncbi:alpha/beta fold hydrolase [Bacteroidota bacterium]